MCAEHATFANSIQVRGEIRHAYWKDLADQFINQYCFERKVDREINEYFTPKDEEELMHKREIVKEHFRGNYRNYLLPSVKKLMGKEFGVSFDKFYSKNKLKNWLKGGNFKNPSNLKDQL